MDPVLTATRANFQALATTVPCLRKVVLIPGSGHWIQQESPGEVNHELLALLAQVAG